ncbi:SCO family protein [Magnetospirillum sp. 15-1]|uniref:SCO family protein n=1 Tax=Magnetospirillum sp. 15-1 TaxID=1979370 RepID=UPI000BBBD33B|nr:SCO family protein [Magnetospirillum sp. 15-1]
MALAVTVLLGAGFLWWSTDELRAFTTEGARRLAVSQQPRALPVVRLEDQGGNSFGFQDYRGQYLVVEFIYSRCPTLCTTLGQSFQRIAGGMAPGRLGRDLSLLSISFDSLHDDTEALRGYAERFGADGRGWRVARLSDPGQLAPLLRTFGVVVVPDDMGGFEHNAALHVVDPAGRLSQIYDYRAANQVIADLGGRR